MKKLSILAMTMMLVVGMLETASALTVGDHTWTARTLQCLAMKA